MRDVALCALAKALTMPLDKEVKAHLIRQFRRIVTEDQIDLLSGFLDDDYLGDDAAQALVSIGSEMANEALLSALEGATSEQNILNLVNALTQSNYKKAEPKLLSLLEKNPEGNLQKVILNALATVGTRESLKVMRNAAAKSNYSYGKNNAVSSYVALLGRLNGTDAKLVRKEAHKLLSIASKQENQGLKSAASMLLLFQGEKEAKALLKSALKAGNIAYLSSLLNAYPFEKDTKSRDLILKQLASSKTPAVQVALINWLTRHDEQKVIPLLTQLVNSSDVTVQETAALSLAKMGGSESLTVLAELLKSNSKERISRKARTRCL